MLSRGTFVWAQRLHVARCSGSLSYQHKTLALPLAMSSFSEKVRLRKEVFRLLSGVSGSFYQLFLFFGMEWRVLGWWFTLQRGECQGGGLYSGEENDRVEVFTIKRRMLGWRFSLLREEWKDGGSHHGEENARVEVFTMVGQESARVEVFTMESHNTAGRPCKCQPLQTQFVFTIVYHHLSLFLFRPPHWDGTKDWALIILDKGKLF